MKLWVLVPAERKREFIEAAAMNLRRGLHPENTVAEMLREAGLLAPEPAGAKAAPDFLNATGYALPRR